MQLASLLVGHTDDAERGADSRGSQSAGVALRHHLAFARHKFRAEFADGLVGGRFFQVHQFCFFHHGALDFRKLLRGRADGIEFPLHALERPEKIYRGGPGFCQRVANFYELGLQRFD